MRIIIRKENDQLVVDINKIVEKLKYEEIPKSIINENTAESFFISYINVRKGESPDDTI